MSTASVATFNYKVVRQFAIMTVVWGIVGMLVGVIIAAQLLWPELNFDIPWLSYGRLRPLHTNAVIFAFGGCALFSTSYYVVQRTCQVRLFSDGLAVTPLVIVAVVVAYVVAARIEPADDTVPETGTTGDAATSPAADEAARPPGRHRSPGTGDDDRVQTRSDGTG